MSENNLIEMTKNAEQVEDDVIAEAEEIIKKLDWRRQIELIKDLRYYYGDQPEEESGDCMADAKDERMEKYINEDI